MFPAWGRPKPPPTDRTSFTGLAAGTYQIQILPSAKLAVGLVSRLGGRHRRHERDPGDARRRPERQRQRFRDPRRGQNQISLRMFLASTGSLTQFLTSLHTAPSVEPAAAAARATDFLYHWRQRRGDRSRHGDHRGDSPTLTSMTVTIQNPRTATAKSCRPITTGTSLTSNYADGVLTVSGVADVADLPDGAAIR